MASNKPYKVIQTQPWTYLDPAGSPVNGQRVTFIIPEFDETHFVFVRSLNPAVVDTAILEFVAQRKQLATD